MRRRTPLVLALSFCLGLSLLALPALPVQASAPVHDAQIVSDVPADTTPHVMDNAEYGPIGGESKVKVNAILPMGNRIYVGGTFTGVRNRGSGTPLARTALFALDPVTHRVDEVFRPELDGPVWALAPSPDGATIFAGGRFTTVNGQSIRRLAKLDAVTGAPVASFRPNPSSEVKDLELTTNGRLVLSGPFSSVAGEARSNLAAVDIHSGALDPHLDIAFTEPRAGSFSRVEKTAVTPDGKTLVAGGNFTRVDGKERWQVALLDITPGRAATVVDWHTHRFNDRDVEQRPGRELACSSAFDAHIKDIAMSPDGAYFVVVTTGGYTSRGPLCDTASRWETSARGSHLQPTWAEYDGGDTYTGVAISGSAVYVAGHNRWLNNFDNRGSSTGAEPGRGSVEREGIAALDPDNGLPLPWNPRRERGHGAEALVVTPQGLWVGSDTNFIGNRDFNGSPRRGEFNSKLAFFPLTGGRPVPHYQAQGLPADLYRIGDTSITRRFFDGLQLGGALTSNGIDASKVRGAFTVGPFLYLATTDDRLVRRTVVNGQFGAPAAVNLRDMRLSEFPLNDMTGMFFDSGRLYFTLKGDRKLHYRHFLAQEDVADDIVGDNQPFQVASGEDDGFDWRGVRGMTYANDQIYYAAGGDLYRVAFSGGKPSGSPTRIARDVDLDGRALFLLPVTTTPPTTPPTTIAPQDPPSGPAGPPSPPGTSPGQSGYWMVGADGRVYPFGEAAHFGDATPHLGGAEAIDLEPTPSYDGYWIVDSRGRVFAFGDARHHGQPNGAALAAGERVTSLSATPSGHGYWIFTNRGRVLPHGDAGFFGDMSGVPLNGPVLDSIRTPSGHGYYMVASDGGIFAFGDAAFHGSMGDRPLNAPVQSLVPGGSGTGYWLVASDGGIFAFGVPFRGSMGSTPLNQPVTGMVPFGTGYLMVAADGGIFNFSDRPFFGSLGDRPPARPVVAVAAVNG